jgi:TRAP-type C4-dicarboxylate transport system substrate-binding protein
MKLGLLVAITGLAAAFLVAPPTIGPALAQGKPMVEGPSLYWKLAAWGKRRAATEGIEKLKEHVEARTGGKFKINIGYESYGSPKELLDLLHVGALEMTTICASYHPEKLPAYSVIDLPLLPISNPDVQERVHLALHDHPIIKAEFGRWNAMPFLSSLLPNNELVGRGKPPASLEDFKGMRVRALAGIGEAMKKLGSIPTSVDATEVYSAVERGMVDAAAFPHTFAHVAYRIHEVGKWYTENMELGRVSCPALINTNHWGKLPQAYRDLLLEARPVAHAASKEAFGIADEKNMPLFRKLTAVRFSEAELARFRKMAAEPIWEEWVVQREAQGIPGRELLDFVLKSARGGPTG